MRITAIAREDLSNIGNGLVPNKITLELSGKIVPDSYGEHIGRYDVEKEVYESFFKKDNEAGNTMFFDAYKKCDCAREKRHEVYTETGIDRGYCINGNYICRYELLFAANGLTSRVVIEYRTNNMPMYDLIKDIEDDIREALEDDSDEDNFFCGIIKNSEICMFDEFGCGIGVEINNADELTAMLASARLLSCEFEEKDGSDGR
jgi:hypothetical protein